MKRRDITARLGAMFLGGVILLGGAPGCQDQLLPPDPQMSEPNREALLYYNDLAAVLDSTSNPWESRITAIRTDGTSRRAIVDGFISSSPRNGRIAFYSGGTLGAPGIYVANDDGSEPSLLVPETEAEYIWPNYITLGPDGRTVAYISESADAKQARLNIRTTSRSDAEVLGPAEVDYSLMCPPVFSRDGRFVAALTTSENFFDQSILLFGVEDGSVRSLPVLLSSTSFYSIFSAPFDWSPDGSSIAFVGVTETGADLMRINVTSMRVDTLTRDSIIEDSPRYVGTSNQIIYAGSDPMTFTGSNLYLRDITGSRRQLTHDEETFKLALGISADGRYVVYTEARGSLPDAASPIRVYDIARQSAGAPIAESIFAVWRQ